jgi:hypothetical protein
MRKLILSASAIVITLTSSIAVSAKEAPVKFNTASCNYAATPVVTDKDGRQNYKIICIRESSTGYQTWSYGIGKDTSVKMTASGKKPLVYNVQKRALLDGKKVIFTYAGTNIRSAVVPAKTQSVVFTTKTPTLGNFADYLNKYSICAQ